MCKKRLATNCTVCSLMRMNFTATTQKMTRTFSQAAFDKAVARDIKSMTAARAKGHRDYKNLTDDQIKAAAESLARIYNSGEVLA